jgi:hypothetical protein
MENHTYFRQRCKGDSVKGKIDFSANGAGLVGNLYAKKC